MNSDIPWTSTRETACAARTAAVPRISRQRPIAEDAPGQDTAAKAPPLEDFERYVARRHASLLRTAYLLTGNRHSAEDLVQTALARVWLAWPRILDPAAVDTYVHRTLINAQRSLWRRRRVGEVLTESVPEPGQGEMNAGAALHEVLWRALAELPRQQRATLVLRYYEDLPTSEIARVLGVSDGTVKSNTSRGLARLRQRALPLAGRGSHPGRARPPLKEPP